MNDELIQKIVAGVLARLRGESGAPAGTVVAAPPAGAPAAAGAPANPPPAPTAPAVVSWTGKVLTVSQLEALGVPPRLAIDARAIVTPSALDLIRERRVELLRGLTPGAAAPGARSDVRLGCLDAGDGVVALATLLKPLAASGLPVEWVSLPGDPYTDGGLAALAEGLAGGRIAGAVVAARLAAVAAYRLARREGVVPLIAERLDELAPAWQRVAASGRPVLILPGAVAAPYRMRRAVEWLIGVAAEAPRGGAAR